MAKPFSSIPGPRGLPMLGSVLEYTSFGPFSYELMHLAKIKNFLKYGAIYKEKLGRNIVELYDPRDVEVIYRSEGEFPQRPPLPVCAVALKRDKIKLGFGNLNGQPWWRFRRAIIPAMLKPDAMNPFFREQLNIAEDFVRLIDRSRQNSESLTHSNLLELLRKFSIEAYGSVCFNVRIGCLEPEVPLSSDAHVIMTSSSAMFEAVQKTTFSFPTYAFFRTASYNQFVEALRACHRLVWKYLEESQYKDNPLIENLSKKGEYLLSMEERVGICMDLFTAGVDATAFALCFLFYNLAKNPEKQKKLREEILSSGEELTQERIGAMSYLKSCIKESFRLNFPVQGGPIRELNKDLILSGYLVPKKTLVSMNFQTMCKLEENFSDPESFVPERWMRNMDVSLQEDLPSVSSVDEPCPSAPLYNHRPAFTFLPFGHGRRMCIGRRFAEQQMILVLIKVMEKYKLESDTDALGMLNRIFSMPDKNVTMTFRPSPPQTSDTMS